MSPSESGRRKRTPVQCGRSVRALRVLTAAEWRAVEALAKGLRPVEIASSLQVSVHTIRTQLKRSMAKVGVHSQASLVAWVFSAD